MGIIRKFIRKIVKEEIEKAEQWENIRLSVDKFNDLYIPREGTKLEVINKDKESIEKYEKISKEWKEFRDSGLLFYINQILHAFGYAICVEIDDDGKIEAGYPTRIPYRGFSQESIDNGYKKLSLYLKNNSNKMHMEAYKDEDKKNN